MRKELVVCLLVAVSVCLTASAQAQLFRRWGAPQVQAPCPQQQLQQQPLQQQQILAQRQRELVPQQRLPQLPRFQAPQTQVNQNVILVEVDQQGRVLRQLTDGRVAQLLRQQQQTRQQQAVQQQVVQQQVVQQQAVRPQAVRPQAVRPQVVQQQVRVVAPNSPQVAVTPLPAPVSRVVLPGVGPNNVAVTRPWPVSQPVVTGYARAPIFYPSAGAQFDIARQATVATPTLAGSAVVAAAQPTAASVATGPTIVETVSLIEPATETPAGTLEVDDLVPDSNVVPAAASEAVSNTVSILESSQEGVSILDSQDDPGSGATLLLSGPEE